MRSKLAAVCLVMLFCALLCAPALCCGAQEVVGSLPANLFATQGDTLEDMRDSTTTESQLGRAAADAVRLVAGSDIAIVNGGDLGSNLRGGDVTWAQICSAFPAERALALAQVTPRQLREILEAAVSHVVVDESERIDHEKSSNGAYPQISGFTFTYDMSCLPGERVQSIRLDGTELELEDDAMLLTLAATEHMLSGGYDMPAAAYEPLGISLREAFAGYIAAGVPEVDESLGRERIIIRGTKDFQIFDRIPGATALVLALIGIIVLAELTRGERSGDRRDLENFRTE